MPRQRGVHKLIGTIGELTYYESPHGFFVRKTGRNNPDKIKNSPKFKRTRNNAEEFGQVAKTAGQLRRLMGPTFHKCGVTFMTSRLMSLLHKTMKEDILHEEGERRVIHSLQHAAGQELLTGFEINAEKPLDSVYKGNIEIDTHTGIIRLSFDERYLQSPLTATHVHFTSAWIRLEAEPGKGHSVITSLEPLLIHDLQDTLEIIPATALPGTGAAILMLHIQFYRKKGDKLESLQEHRCGQVVGVR